MHTELTPEEVAEDASLFETVQSGEISFAQYVAAFDEVLLNSPREQKSLFWNGPHGVAANGGERPKLRSLDDYDPGSSLVHTDFLRHPYEIMSGGLLGSQRPGPVDLGMLRDMGWQITESAIPIVPGDYDGNGVVEIRDYEVWKESYDAIFSGFFADGNGDGRINAADYVVWRNNLGASESAALVDQTTIPEPQSAAMAMMVSLFALAGRHVAGTLRVPLPDSRTCVSAQPRSGERI